MSTCSKDCSNLRLSPYLCYGNVAGPLQPFAAHVVVSLLPRNIAQHIKRPHCMIDALVRACVLQDLPLVNVYIAMENNSK